MKKLTIATAALALFTLIGTAQADIIVNSIGDNGWYSSDTRNASGVVLNGLNYTHGGTGTAADDVQIAQLVKFVDNGYSPSPNGIPLTMTGSTNGALQLYGTTGNNGKASLTRLNLDGFGSTSDLLGSLFYANYRQFTIKDTTFRTTGLSIGVLGTDNQWWSLSYVEPALATAGAGVWVESNLTNASQFALYGLYQGGGIKKSLSDWATDATWAPILFGNGAIVTQFGFNLGSFQRNAYGYIDWVETNVLDSGVRNEFAAVPEPSSIIALLGGLGSLVAFRRRKA